MELPLDRQVAHKWKYAWNVWRHIRLLFYSIVVNGKISRWALWNTCMATTIPITQFKWDKQETWKLTTVCKQWKSDEIWSRTTRYAWTYITSCDNNPSQNPGTSFYRFPSNRDRRMRWLSVSEMNESQLRVPVVSLFQAPSRWQCQKETNGSLRSAPSVAVSVTETIAVTFEV